MQVTLGLEIDNGLMILPAGYPGYERFSAEHAHNSPEDLGPCLFLSIPSLQLHLRSNDYYMGRLIYDRCGALLTRLRIQRCL